MKNPYDIINRIRYGHEIFSLSGEILFAEYTLQTLSKYSEAISFWAVSRITGSGTDFDFRSPMIAFRISGIQP